MTMKTVEQRITDFIRSLRECGVEINYKNPHWIARDPEKRRRANRLLKTFFKHFGLYSKGQILKRCCNSKGCLNPFHYGQVPDMGNVSKENLIEIAELAEMINLEDLEDMGFTRYFLYFNEDNPIPAKKEDFFIACNRKLRQAKKNILSREVLND